VNARVAKQKICEGVPASVAVSTSVAEVFTAVGAISASLCRVRIRIIGALLLASMGQAAAQGADAAAGPLFDRGLAEMEAGAFAIACPKIAESFRLDPRAGTLFTLAECESRAGKSASAAVHYADYLSRVEQMTTLERQKQKARPAIAEKQVVALRGQVPLLTIEVAGSVPEGATLRRDGTQFGIASLGVELPADPGEHELTMTLADGQVVRERFALRPSERRVVRISVPPAKGSASNAAAEPSRTTSAPLPSFADEHRRSHLGWTIATGALGAVGIAAGSIAGGAVLEKKGIIEGNCRDTVCNRTGKDAADSARSLGLVSTVAFVLGGAFAALSVVLLLTEPSGPKVRVGLGHITLEGSW
jgi:hypothetical protein